MARKNRKPKEEFKYLRNPGIGIPAQVVGEEFARIRAENDDVLTPAVVVDEARPEEAVLHPAFEWDDELAGEKWRHHQARNLICVVQVVEPAEDPSQPPEAKVAYVSIGSKQEGACYVSSALIVSNEDVRARVLSDAISHLKAWRRRFAHLNELAGLFQQIDQIDEAALLLPACTPN